MMGLLRVGIVVVGGHSGSLAVAAAVDGMKSG